MKQRRSYADLAAMPEETTLRGEKRTTLNFLGFTFYNGISHNGKYRVGCRAQSERLNAAMNRITMWCKENRHIERNKN